jgi:hypothetical protein
VGSAYSLPASSADARLVILLRIYGSIKGMLGRREGASSFFIRVRQHRAQIPARPIVMTRVECLQAQALQ